MPSTTLTKTLGRKYCKYAWVSTKDEKIASVMGASVPCVQLHECAVFWKKC